MKNKLVYSIIALVIVIAALAFMIYGYYLKDNFEYQNPVVTMEIENYGTVKMELYPEHAPNTVTNFIKLINEGYYDGLTFHRVEDMLIQGGDVNGDGTGETLYTIPGEFSENDYKEKALSFERGTVGLARQDYSMLAYYTGDYSYLEQGYNSGCAQFFIMAQEYTDFNGYYCAFGKVTEGMDIVDKIKALETKVETTTDEETGETTENETTIPVNPPVIKSMTVETYGIDYGEPEIVE